ncbi:MAG TPA: FISUMP domain-containing protein [Bacteroidales bacterium]|nr:FISUMP domain-containing protein [Bacteroidales bacterium]
MQKKTIFFQIPVILLAIFLVVVHGCKKNDPNDETPPDNSTKIQVPVLTTDTAGNITHTSVRCGGKITSDGGATVTTRGVCWSANPSPTTANATTSDGAGAGSFASTVTGLTSNTTYYLRAYATNSAGTAYGNEITFTTKDASWATITDVEGNVYHTITIGTQVWMLENLKTTKYRNGVSIPNVSTNANWEVLGTGAYCNYNNDVLNADTYGRLYNWFAVNDSRKLAPEGWHISSYADWYTLISYLGGESVAGGKLKEAGSAHWCIPNSGATNEVGFTALPSGYRNLWGTFSNKTYQALWWCSSEGSPDLAWAARMVFSAADVAFEADYKKYGCAVRCVKD